MRAMTARTLLAVITTAVEAMVRYVKADAGGADSGASWSDAFTSLQSALAIAVDGDEIRVAAGSYRPAGPDGNRAATFQLKTGVALYGGFPRQPGQEGDFGVRNPAFYVTVLSGDLNGDDGPNFASNAENSYHVVTGSGKGATAVLDGLTIYGGEADDRGGGMSNLASSSPTLTNCTFSGNEACRGHLIRMKSAATHHPLNRWQRGIRLLLGER